MRPYLPCGCIPLWIWDFVCYYLLFHAIIIPMANRFLFTAFSSTKAAVALYLNHFYQSFQEPTVNFSTNIRIAPVPYRIGAIT